MEVKQKIVMAMKVMGWMKVLSPYGKYTDTVVVSNTGSVIYPVDSNKAGYISDDVSSDSTAFATGIGIELRP